MTPYDISQATRVRSNGLLMVKVPHPVNLSRSRSSRILAQDIFKSLGTKSERNWRRELARSCKLSAERTTIVVNAPHTIKSTPYENSIVTLPFLTTLMRTIISLKRLTRKCAMVMNIRDDITFSIFLKNLRTC